MPHTETFIDGVWYPSTTTITSSGEKPWIVAWRDKWGELAERKLEISSALGTEFHRCIESWLDTGTYDVQAPIGERTNKPMPSLVPRVQKMMASWVGWAKSVDGVICQTELKVYSRTHTYSGTIDAIGTVRGKPMVVDWKTSSRIYDDMQTQLSAYKEAYNELRNSPEWVLLYPRNGQSIRLVKDGLIVHVSKDKPDFKVTEKEFKLGKRAFNKFLKLRSMFDDIAHRVEV